MCVKKRLAVAVSREDAAGRVPNPHRYGIRHGFDVRELN